MNKDKCQGFVAGVMASALFLGLGGAALAAGRTIEVEDGIAVTINGVPFTPRNAGGEEVPLFAYNGTTYAPVRAFSKAAGLTVDYDAAGRVARIETADYAAAADPGSGSYITAEKARELALADAGVAEADAFFLKSYLDWEDGRAVYDVEFCAGTAEYDYELDALTGRVLEKDYECEDYDWAHRDGHHNYHAHHGGYGAQAAGDYITVDKAKELALGDAGVDAADALFLKSYLDWEDGRAVYEVKFLAGDREYDYELDAVTGQVLEKDWSGRDRYYGGYGSQAAPQGLISAEAAQATGLERLPGGTVRKCELDYDDGHWKYELELWLNGVEYECVIDAASGAVLKWKPD